MIRLSYDRKSCLVEYSAFIIPLCHLRAKSLRFQEREKRATKENKISDGYSLDLPGSSEIRLAYSAARPNLQGINALDEANFFASALRILNMTGRSCALWIGLVLFLSTFYLTLCADLPGSAKTPEQGILLLIFN